MLAFSSKRNDNVFQSCLCSEGVINLYGWISSSSEMSKKRHHFSLLIVNLFIEQM